MTKFKPGDVLKCMCDSSRCKFEFVITKIEPKNIIGYGYSASTGFFADSYRIDRNQLTKHPDKVRAEHVWADYCAAMLTGELEGSN